MVSKTVLVAFMAVCVAAAYAAPTEEKMHIDTFNVVTCWKATKETVTIVKEASSIFHEIKDILAAAKEDKEKCQADTKSVADCEKKVQDAELSKIMQETQKLASAAVEVYNLVKDFKDCL